MERVAAEDEPALAIEDAQVRRWRHEQFVLLGFSDAQALLLAGSEADLGKRATSSTAAAPSPSHCRFSSSSPLASVEAARIAGLLVRPSEEEACTQ